LTCLQSPPPAALPQRPCRARVSGSVRTRRRHARLAVPGNHRIRFCDVECRAPRGPFSTKPGPQHPVEPVHSRLFHGALQDAKLMAKREDLEEQCRSSLEKGQRYGKTTTITRPWGRIDGKCSTPTVSARSEFTGTTHQFRSRPPRKRGRNPAPAAPGRHVELLLPGRCLSDPVAGQCPRRL